MKLFAKKSLGQHFLNSNHVLSQIIEASDIKKGDFVLEIGPGTGILTKALLDSGANVVAIEKDSRAIENLRNIKENSLNIETRGKFDVIEGDILETDINSIQNFGKKYSVIANIPYYITGAILEKFLEYQPRPEKMVLLVQKEVAERVVAKDGKESILSISIKAFGEPKMIARVPKGAFTPPPNVESAILAIYNISGDKFGNDDKKIKRFFSIVKAGFAHKRKILRRNLESVIEIEKIDKIWSFYKIDPNIRAEDVSLDLWLKMALFID